MNYSSALFLIGLLLILDSFFYLYHWREFKAMALGLMLAGMGLAAIGIALVVSGKISEFPFLLGMRNMFGVLVAPCCTVLVIKSLWEREFYWKKSYLFLFILPAIIPVLMIPYYLLPLEAKLAVIAEITNGEKSYFTAFPLVAGFHYVMVVGSMFFAIFNIYSKFNRRAAPRKLQLKVMSGGAVIFIYAIYVLYATGEHLFFPVRTDESKGVGSLIYYFVSYLFFRFVQFWPYYFRNGMLFFDTRTFKIEQYFSKNLKSIDVLLLEKKLNDMLENEKVFRDDSLTSAMLARKLGISNHQLSAYLNQYRHQSFSELINLKRIEDAKEIMCNEPRIKIIEVGYRAGFNTLSNFYRVFREFEGLPPLEWKKRKMKRK